MLSILGMSMGKHKLALHAYFVRQWVNRTCMQIAWTNAFQASTITAAAAAADAAVPTSAAAIKQPAIVSW